MWHFIVTLPIRIILSAIFAGIGTAVVVFFINAFIMPFKKAAALKDAINAGRVITAHRYDYKYPTGVDDILTERYVKGYYSYEAEGKKRKIRLFFAATPPEEITLYYKNNPMKAKTYDSFGDMETGSGTIFFIMMIVCFVFSVFFM